MAKITDPSRLLPSAKSSSSIVKVGRSSIVPTIKFSKKSISLSTDVLRRKRKENQDAIEVNSQLVRIQKFLLLDLETSKKESEKKRKQEETEDFSKAEQKLETPKVKGFKFPKMNFPAVGLLERIKRFLFFTAIGWLLPKIIEFIPKLEGFLKLTAGVYLFVEDIFNKLLDGFSTLVKFGGDLKDKTIGFLAEAKVGSGGNYQKEFNKLESQFNNFVNLSIVSGLLGTDIALAAVDEFKKWRKKNAEISKPKPPEPAKPGAKAGAKITIGQGGKPGLGKGVKITGSPKPKPSLWEKLTGGLKSKFSKVGGKLAGPFSKFAGAAIPGLGAAVGFVDANIRSKSGDKLGAFLAGLSASLDAFTAAVAVAGLASAATGVGLPAAAVLATAATAAGAISMSIDVILLIRDILKAFGVPVFNKGGRVVRKYQGGGNTRGGRPVGKPPRRTLTPVKRKPFKISPQKSQPGKDVGGKREIEILYPDSKKKLSSNEWMDRNEAGTYAQYEEHYKKTISRPNSYKVLTSASQAYKDLPAGLGHIVGAAIDSALGQKVDVKRAVQQFSSGMSYLAENYANQRVSMSMSSLARDMNTFADGGFVPPSRQMKGTNETMNFGQMLSRVLEPAINMKINEVIQNVRKEINKKGKKKEDEGGGLYDSGLGVEGGDVVTGGNADFWALAAIAALENSDPEGRADVAQAIYNRVAAGKKGINFGQRTNTILGHIIASGQFSPVGESNSSLWAGITDKQSAIAAIESHPNGKGRGEQLINAAAAAITNPGLQRSAAEYIGGRTDFAVPLKANKAPGGFGYVERHNHLFGWYVGPGAISYGRTNPGPAVVPSLGNVTVMRGVQAGASFVSDGGVQMAVSSGYMTLERPKHAGVDIVSQSGPTAHLPVVIKKSGIVVFAGISEKNMGMVEINHSDGSTTRHLHVNQFRVKTNDSVRPGQVLARLADMGEPGIGNATGPHLHFEWYPKGSNRAANPTSKWRSYVSLGGRITQISSAPLDQNIPPSVSSQQPPRQQPSRPGTESRGQVLKSTKLGPGYVITIRRNSNGNIEYYENNKPMSQERINSLREIWADAFTVPQETRRGQIPQTTQGTTPPNIFQKIGNLFGLGVGKRDGEKKYGILTYFRQNGKYYIENPYGKPQIREINKADYDSIPYQKGGLIAPSTSRLSIPNSFASYENPSSTAMIAIQPIIIEKTTPTPSSGNSLIAFPVLVSVNNHSLDSYRG